MKFTKFEIFASALLAVLAGVLTNALLPAQDKIFFAVRPNEVWVYRPSQDPWGISSSPKTNFVMAVKGDWIQYSNSQGFVWADHYRWFISGSEKIK